MSRSHHSHCVAIHILGIFTKSVKPTKSQTHISKPTPPNNLWDTFIAPPPFLNLVKLQETLGPTFLKFEAPICKFQF